MHAGLPPGFTYESARDMLTRRHEMVRYLQHEWGGSFRERRLVRQTTTDCHRKPDWRIPLGCCKVNILQLDLLQLVDE